MTFTKYALFMHSIISLLMLTNPLAFKTKHRYNDEDGKLIGVDPLISLSSFGRCLEIEKFFVGVINWWRSHEHEEE